MKEATRIRAENLKAWIDEYYGGKQAAFIEKTGMNQGELSALINGRRYRWRQQEHHQDHR